MPRRRSWRASAYEGLGSVSQQPDADKYFANFPDERELAGSMRRLILLFAACTVAFRFGWQNPRFMLERGLAVTRGAPNGGTFALDTRPPVFYC
jgi:hypothetical protein